MAVAFAEVVIGNEINRTPRGPRIGHREVELVVIQKLAGDVTNTFNLTKLKHIFAAAIYDGLTGLFVASATTIVGQAVTFTGNLGGNTSLLLIALGNTK